MRHAGDDAQNTQNTRGNTQHLGRQKHLRANLAAQVFFFAHAGHHHRGRYGNEQPRNLRHQGIAHGQQNVAVSGLADAEVVLQHAHHQATQNIDDQNQNAGHSVAAHKLGCTVHGAKKVGFFCNFGAAAFGFFVVNSAGAQVGVHRHLFARHGIQGKACRNFGNPLGAFGHHNKVNNHQNGKHNQTHGKVAAN